jgi:hypothetical protein
MSPACPACALTITVDASLPTVLLGLALLSAAVYIMRDMITLQRQGDSAALVPYLQSLIVPEPERWFTSKFGDTHCGEQRSGPNDCLGPRLAFTYRSLASVLPASFALTFTDLIHEGFTSFEAANYTEQCPGPQRIVPARKLVGGLTTTPFLSRRLSVSCSIANRYTFSGFTMNTRKRHYRSSCTPRAL